MALTWTLAEIRARWRAETGRSQTTDISDSDVNDLINDYYVNHFPSDAGVDEFDGFFTQLLLPTDSGVYAVAQNVDRLDDPVTINGNQILLCRNREMFFSGQGGLNAPVVSNSFVPFNSYGLSRYEDEQYITDPCLSIGTDPTKVLHAAFDYRISGFSYSKASSEVDLTGDTIPQNKYGAWSLKIDTEGSITVAAATLNGTGYHTPRKALEGLTESDSESAYMGYVTVISTDAGGFVPGITQLDDVAVTDTYTDGRFEIRDTPTIALLYGQNLYVRPRPNDIYEFKALTIANRPTALTIDTATPDDQKWGPAIARGAVLLYLSPRGGQERIEELAKTTKYMFDSIKLDKYKRLKNRLTQAHI